MRKIFIIVMSIVLNVTSVFALQKAILLQPRNTGTNTEHDRPRRAPERGIDAMIDDRVITVDDMYEGCIVEFVQNDGVVYTSTVDENGEIEIPSYIFGDCEMILYFCGKVYFAYIEL